MSEDPGPAPDVDVWARAGAGNVPAAGDRTRTALNQCPHCATRLVAMWRDQVLDVVQLWQQLQA